MSFSINHGLFKYDLTDHYAVLGMPIGSDPKQVRKQYLKIARSLHPDTLKGKSDAEKKQASDVLSKLVNPAYKQLSKPATVKEYDLVLEQTGKRLRGEQGKVSLEGDAAKKLAKASSASLDSASKTAVKQLASSQYKALESTTDAIAQLSELNMVYLIRKQGKVARQATTPPPVAGKDGKKPINEPPVEPPKESPAEAYVRRGREYIAKKNYAKAVLELREALPLDPNNSSAHALLGMCYLKQNQATMAKIHINKALAANPQDPLVTQAKEALERVTGQSLTPKTSANNGKGKATAAGKTRSQPAQKQKKGLFGGLFGGDKK